MARFDNEIRIIASVLDRLIDYEPELSHEPLLARAKSLRQLKQSVRRDLEWLLNTRQTPIELAPELQEVNRSLFVYGLPDFTNLSVKNPEEVEQMRREIARAIEIFEPRLQDIQVTLEPLYELEHALHFRIDGQLKIEPAPEPVTFDTILRLDSGRYVVEGE
ncbi:MAG: type VI secretion system baseplate subunit TssE [Acidobacteriota bacterium]